MSKTIINFTEFRANAKKHLDAADSDGYIVIRRGNKNYVLMKWDWYLNLIYDKKKKNK